MKQCTTNQLIGRRNEAIFYLASKGAKAKSVEQTATTNVAIVGNPFALAWLRPTSYKHDPCTIYNVCLDAAEVDGFLNLTYSNHIVV